jgi:hypothetical protein
MLLDRIEPIAIITPECGKLPTIKCNIIITSSLLPSLAYRTSIPGVPQNAYEP